MNGEGDRDPTADRAIRNAGRLPKPIWNVVKAVRKVLNVSHLELVEIRIRDRTTGREHKWGGDINGEKGSGAVHRRMRADQRDGKGHSTAEKEAADHRADERIREQSGFSVQSAALQNRGDSVHL